MAEEKIRLTFGMAKEKIQRTSSPSSIKSNDTPIIEEGRLSSSQIEVAPFLPEIIRRRVLKVHDKGSLPSDEVLLKKAKLHIFKFKGNFRDSVHESRLLEDIEAEALRYNSAQRRNSCPVHLLKMPKRSGLDSGIGSSFEDNPGTDKELMMFPIELEEEAFLNSLELEDKQAVRG